MPQRTESCGVSQRKCLWGLLECYWSATGCTYCVQGDIYDGFTVGSNGLGKLGGVQYTTPMYSTKLDCHFHGIQSPNSYTPSSAVFVAMLDAYRATGGTERGEDLATLLQNRVYGGYASLARLVGTRQVLGFKWRNTYWVPLFQFNMKDLSLRPEPQQVMAELCKDFDEWGMAVWFTQPNAWLNDEIPVDMLKTYLKAVIDAARAERFVTAG